MLAATDPDHTTALLALSAENAELRRRLAAAQDLLVETAAEVGELRGHAEVMRFDLAEARADRDAWRSEAERLVGWGARTA